MKNSDCSWLTLNPIIFDLETTSNQLLIGFFFTSTQTFVQFVVDSKDSIAIQIQTQTILLIFFEELNSISSMVEKEWVKTFKGPKNSFTFTFISGFNINNFDIPVISKFMETSANEFNPVIETRKLAKNLLQFKESRDFTNYSKLMQNFLFVDLLWWLSGRLTNWVDILNDSEEFKRLEKKRWKKQPLVRWDNLQVNNWLIYNRNDLIASHVLGIFSNNYFNFILLRLAYSKTVGSQISLGSIFRDRYVI